MSWSKGDFLYEGKAKKIFAVAGDTEKVWMEFKDSLTAFNGVKSGSFVGKGTINAQVAASIFRYLKQNQVVTHFVEAISDNEMICEKVKIIPLEVVVRNRLAGSTAKRLGFTEGTAMPAPLVEFYYKDDELNDPFISDDQALLLKAAENLEELEKLKSEARAINQILIKFFDKMGIELIDFKLEFGRTGEGTLVLADEITPDCCRLWDKATGEKMDKDRFRRDLGDVAENYQQVWLRIQKQWETTL